MAPSWKAIEPAILNAISRRVDVVVRAVVQDRADAGHRVAGQDSALQRFLDALLGRLDELARDRSADDFVDELEPAFRHRLEAHLDVAVLTLTARLPHELALGFRLARDRFAIRDLRLADVRGDAELAHHAVDDDLEVQLAHAADDGLVRFRVRVDLERRVFLHELRERDAHLFLVDLRLRLDGDGDDRLGERHRLEDDRLVPVADRVAGGDAAQTDGRADVARPHFLDLFALVGVHLQQASDALGRCPWSC